MAHRLDGGDCSDGELLQQFLDTRDEAPFVALIRRHGAMVFGVCQRTLANAQDTEDAFQATFLVLVRKASKIRHPELLGNWLYGVALRTARKARTYAARRRARERPMLDHEAISLQEAAFDDLRPVLDEEVSRLPKQYRLPFVLCYLESKSMDEAARHLGCPSGTIKSRLSWARERLRERLLRRGINVSSAGVAVALSQNAARASVPTSLVTATAHAAAQLAIGAAGAAVISAEVAALTQGVIKAMLLTKIMSSVTLIAAILVAGLTVVIAIHGPLAAREPESPQPLSPSAVSNALAASPSQQAQHDTPPQHEADQWSDRKTVKEVVSKAFDSGRTPRVIVEMVNGGIKILADSENRVAAEVTKQVSARTEELAREGLKRIDVQMTKDGDIVHVIARQPEEHDGQITYGASAELHVPSESTLDLHTSNGGVSAKDLKGPAKIQTANGGIRVAGKPGNLELNTSNGSIIVTGGHGEQKLHTSNGSIQIQAEQALVTAKTTNGSVQFQGSLADGTHSFITTNGSVAVTLPAGARFNVDAATTMGRIHSQFDIKPPAGRDRTHLRGSIGENPAISLKLRSSNGNIELREAK
jgi:RNA polymerase sigma factor (sigma-70 family)